MKKNSIRLKGNSNTNINDSILPTASVVQKKTLILTLDDCLLKTSIFKTDLPRVDGAFDYNNLTIYVCFRPHLTEMMDSLKTHFELIVWTSSQNDYTE